MTKKEFSDKYNLNNDRNFLKDLELLLSIDNQKVRAAIASEKVNAGKQESYIEELYEEIEYHKKRAKPNNDLHNEIKVLKEKIRAVDESLKDANFNDILKLAAYKRELKSQKKSLTNYKQKTRELAQEIFKLKNKQL